MQVQRVNNQQSFSATMKYQTAIPQRLHSILGEKEVTTKTDEFGFQAKYALETLADWLKEQLPQRATGKFEIKHSFAELYKPAKAVQLGEDVVVLEESKVPQDFNLPSIIKIIFGNNTEGTATITRGWGETDEAFDKAAELIKAV